MSRLTTVSRRLAVDCSRESVSAPEAYGHLLDALDERRGMLTECATTYPGRYRPEWRGFVDPALQIVYRRGALEVSALSQAGLVPLGIVGDALGLPVEAGAVRGDMASLGGFFGMLKRLTAAFACDAPSEAGFFCALGYDLALERHGIERRLPRAAGQKDAILLLPETLVVCRDPASGVAERLTFTYRRRDGGAAPAAPPSWPGIARWPDRPEPAEPAPGSYRAVVERAREACRDGRLFEVVAGQSFRRRSPYAPSALYRRLSTINPSPYGFLANLDGEHLVGCSPEIFLRVSQGSVESAPISGTVRRGRDAQEDAERVLELLGSQKAAAELTMCSDVDRNDKASVCLPGTIELLGRRQIETYSHLIHTVDHVRGRLRPDRDAVDALEAHLWSVTMTGAPRRAALTFIEENENTPRRWYGGAIGRLGLDGSLDSGIVLRSLQLIGDVAEVRVGASLLHASDPEEEERETLVKAEAMFRALAAKSATVAHDDPTDPAVPPTVALPAVDLCDVGGPFASLLSSMLAEVGRPASGGKTVLLTSGSDPVSHKEAARLVGRVLEGRRPLLAVGHAMLALAEALGAQSRVEAEPRQGSSLRVIRVAPSLERLLPPGSAVGCYHRARLDETSLPGNITPLAWAKTGEILAFEAAQSRVIGLLFHPESLLTRDGAGLLNGFLDRVETM